MFFNPSCGVRMKSKEYLYYVRRHKNYQKRWSRYAHTRLRPVLRIRIRDQGSCAFLTPGPGSGIRNRFIPDTGSRIPDPDLDPGSWIPDGTYTDTDNLVNSGNQVILIHIHGNLDSGCFKWPNRKFLILNEN